ncbi:MAG: hypothetical protein J0G99_10495 [Alphaproteobacteria bacterium]|mgnify:FL=1|nr:hypothetical protein [Alphaproteobacteria bacterium]
MDPFYRVLTINCPNCGIHLVRVAQTAHLDFAVCPSCMAAGVYEEVVGDPARLTARYALPEAVKEFVSRLDRQ